MASEDKEAASPTGLDPKLYDCDHLFAGVDFTKDTKQKTWQEFPNLLYLALTKYTHISNL